MPTAAATVKFNDARDITHARVLADKSDSWPVSEHLPARACDCTLDLECRHKLRYASSRAGQ